MRRELAVCGPIASEEAWDRYRQVSRWPAWAPFIVAVEASGEVLVPGLTGVVRGRFGLRVHFVVDDVDHIRRSWHWSVRSGPVSLRLGHEVLARPGGGAVATLTLAGPAAVVLAYAPLARSALVRLTR